MRESTVECHSLEMGCMACCRTPSMRYLTATSESRASMWMSLARRSSAVKITVSTRRTTGLTVLSRVSRSPEIVSSLSSSSFETCSVNASVACSRTRCDCSVRFRRSPICRAVATRMSQFLAEQQRQFVAQQHLAGIGSGDGQNIVLHFQRHEVVAEHQVRRNGAKKFRIDALLAQINERNSDSVPPVCARLSRSCCSSALKIAGATSGLSW